MVIKMTLAEQAARKRRTLEEAGKLSHDESFDNRIKSERKSGMLVLALLVALAYGFAIDVYYRVKYPVAAHSGEILAKSEMSKPDIKALNIARAPVEKRL